MLPLSVLSLFFPPSPRPDFPSCLRCPHAAQRYVINIKQIAKFVVGLGDKVAPTDVEEGMRVGVDRNKYQIQIPLPPKIDPTVTMMQVCRKRHT